MKEVLQKNNHLKVGLNISLHEEVADKSNYYETLLIGWKKDRFLVGDTPVLSGKPVSIPKGSYFIGHFQSYRTVYGFETSVLDVKTEPYPIIFLAYPNIVKEMYLRRHQRTKINTPASIYSIVTRNGSIMDISEGGCLLETEYSYDVGSQFYLSFALPEGPKVEHVKAVVRNVRRRFNKILLGIEFAESLKS